MSLKQQGVPDTVLNALIDKASGLKMNTDRAPVPPQAGSLPILAEAKLTTSTRVAERGPADAPIRRFGVLVMHLIVRPEGIVTVGRDRVTLTNTTNGKTEFSELTSNVTYKKLGGLQSGLAKIAAKNDHSFTINQAHPLTKHTGSETGGEIEQAG